MKKAKSSTSLKLFLTTLLSLFIFLIGILGLWLTYYSISDGIINKSMLTNSTVRARYVRVEGNSAVFHGLLSSFAGLLIFLASLGAIAYLFATYNKKT